MLAVHQSTIVRFPMILKWLRLLLGILLLFNTFYVSDFARRIRDGETVQEKKSYMVYLVQASKSHNKYDAWLCGGALVSSLFILTSAACVEDVEYMYAIAGYSAYVPDKHIETNRCTKETKRKVVYICVPVNYRFTYEKVPKWSAMDIALAKVDKSYDPIDTKFKELCSYTPTIIPVNFDARFTEPGTDAIVLGWGHRNIWRLPEDARNYNQKNLNYASVRIQEKDLCKKEYSEIDQMEEVINQYMICSWEKGMLNDRGTMLEDGYDGIPPTPKLDGCKQEKLRTIHDILEDEGGENPLVVDKTRKVGCLRSNPISNDTTTETENRTLFNTTRRQISGICQNDHGGPLVTWAGASEVVIGVASVFKIDEELRLCHGPYLYTSTRCTSLFIDCHLAKTRRSICDSSPIKRGYDVFERHISWDEHPVGRAEENRTLEKTRMHEFYGKLQKFWTPFRNQLFSKNKTNKI